MLERRLLKCLLNYDFYQANRHIVSEELFADDLAKLYGTLVYAHDKWKKDLTPNDLYELHFARHPDATYATKNNIGIIRDNLEEEQGITPEIAAEVLASAARQNLARKIGELSIDILNGKSTDFSPIIKLLETGSLNDNKELVPITDDVHELLQAVEANTKWAFNLASLSKHVRGLGPGMFAIMGARPEVGKTAFYVSLTFGPGGFAEQGAKVGMFLNEEPAVRTRLRGYSAYTGLTHLQIINSVDEVRKYVAKIKNNVYMYDCVGISIEEIEGIAAREKFDILIIDNLDKVRMSGESSDREDQRLKNLYIRTRELTKTLQCATIGISQVSADGEGKIRLSQSMLENSRTGKAAEADAIILIGSNGTLGDVYRNLNLVKNKISGVHCEIGCKLNAPISRYEE